MKAAASCVWEREHCYCSRP